MPVRVSADVAAERWAAGVQRGGQKMAEGIERVTTSPGVKAAAKAQKWLNNTVEAAPKWQAAVSRVSLEDWKESMRTLGVSRAAAGAAAKVGKFQDAIAPVLSFQNSVLSRVDAMPDTTLEDRINKSATYQREMAKYRR